MTSRKNKESCDQHYHYSLQNITTILKESTQYPLHLFFFVRNDMNLILHYFNYIDYFIISLTVFKWYYHITLPYHLFLLYYTIAVHLLH